MQPYGNCVRGSCGSSEHRVQGHISSDAAEDVSSTEDSIDDREGRAADLMFLLGDLQPASEDSLDTDSEHQYDWMSEDNDSDDPTFAEGDESQDDDNGDDSQDDDDEDFLKYVDEEASDNHLSANKPLTGANHNSCSLTHIVKDVLLHGANPDTVDTSVSLLWLLALSASAPSSLHAGLYCLHGALWPR